MALVVAALDTTWGQATADAVLVLLVAINVWLGWRFGLLRRAFGIAGLFIGCLAASNIGNPLAGLLDLHSVSANAWCFVAVLVVVVVTMEILGHLFNERLQRVAVVLFDRIAGAIAGVALGLGQALVLFLVVLAVGSSGGKTAPGGAASAVRAGTLSGQAVRLEPELRAILGPALPGDLSGHLEQGATVATPPL